VTWCIGIEATEPLLLTDVSERWVILAGKAQNSVRRPPCMRVRAYVEFVCKNIYITNKVQVGPTQMNFEENKEVFLPLLLEAYFVGCNTHMTRFTTGGV
jgi:hypothetical protein